MRRWLVFLEYSLASWLVWLLLAQSAEAAELITGAIAAFIAAGIAVGGSERAGQVGALPVVVWSRRLPRLSWLVLRGTFRVFGTLRYSAELRRRGMGRLVVRPISTWGAAPRDIVERATAIWESSLAPDEYVAVLERDGGRFLVHQLPPGHDDGEVESRRIDEGEGLADVPRGPSAQRGPGAVGEESP